MLFAAEPAGLLAASPLNLYNRGELAFFLTKALLFIAFLFSRQLELPTVGNRAILYPS